jgi:hypothetical protein
VLGLRTLLALRDDELDPLVFVQAWVAVGLDREEVDEDVLAPAITQSSSPGGDTGL